MNISKFADNRENIKNQYSSFYKKADNEKAKKLYEQIQSIYYGEKHKSIGFGKTVKYYFENVEVCVDTSDIFSDMANAA